MSNWLWIVQSGYPQVPGDRSPIGNKQQDAINKGARMIYNLLIIINNNIWYPCTGGANTINRHKNATELQIRWVDS